MNPKVQGPEKDALLRPLTVAWFLVICDSSAGGTGGTVPFVPDLELKGLSLSVTPSIEEKQRLYPLHPMIEEKQYHSMEQKWNEKDRPLVPHPMIEEKQYLSMEQKWNEKDRPLVPGYLVS